MPKQPPQTSWPQVTKDVVGGGQGHVRRVSLALENSPVSGVSTWLTPTPIPHPPP